VCDQANGWSSGSEAIQPRRQPRDLRPFEAGLEFFPRADGTPCAGFPLVDIAVDVTFEPSDAFRATLVADGSQPLVIEPEPKPSSVPPAPLSLRATEPVAAPLDDVRRPARWPLVLCGFIAVMCATIAFLMSPLAQHPSVAPYASALMDRI
jgi:hypothetical protein